MAFVPYDNKGRGPAGGKVPLVSVRSSGSMDLNRAAVQLLAPGPDARIRLYYDADTHRVGLRLVGPEDQGAQKLGGNTDHPLSKFSGLGLLHAIGADFTETHRYPLARDEESGLLVFSLNGHGPNGGTP